MIKEPRFAEMGAWIQDEDCIHNRVPLDAVPAELIDSGRRADETFTSMILKDRIYGDLEIRSVMSFDDRMAPLIILKAALDSSVDGFPENRDMYNVVVFDKGIRVWRYLHAGFVAGQPPNRRAWHEVAFSQFRLLPKTKYEVIVTARKYCIEVKLENHHLGFTDNAMPYVGYVGICGCEGVNRFYDFAIRNLK